jgi:hypothetical protein
MMKSEAAVATVASADTASWPCLVAVSRHQSDPKPATPAGQELQHGNQDHCGRGR